MTVPAHPFADEATDQRLVYDTRCASVRLTGPLRLFFGSAVADGLCPVLVTSVEAQLSPFAAASLAEAGGSWVVRSADGPFDAVTGQALTSFDDLAHPPTGLHPQFPELPPHSCTVVTYDVYTTLLADSRTRVGRTAQALTAALGGTSLDLWGTVEPLLDSWDSERITAFTQTRMPRAPVVLAGGRCGEYARIWVARSRHGLSERSQGGVLTPTPERLTDLVPFAAQALVAAMNDRVNVSVALAWASARSEAAACAPSRPTAGRSARAAGTARPGYRPGRPGRPVRHPGSRPGTHPQPAGPVLRTRYRPVDPAGTAARRTDTRDGRAALRKRQAGPVRLVALQGEFSVRGFRV